MIFFEKFYESVFSIGERVKGGLSLGFMNKYLGLENNIPKIYFDNEFIKGNNPQRNDFLYNTKKIKGKKIRDIV